MSASRILCLLIVLFVAFAGPPAASLQIPPRPAAIYLQRNRVFSEDDFHAGFALIDRELAGRKLEIRFKKRKRNGDWILIATSRIKIRRQGRVDFAFHRVRGQRCRFVAVWHGRRPYGPAKETVGFRC